MVDPYNPIDNGQTMGYQNNDLTMEFLSCH